MRNFLLCAAILPMVLTSKVIPMVIAQVGPTVNVNQYIPKIKMNKQSYKAIDAKKLINRDFEVHSRLLTVGDIKSRKLKVKEHFNPIYLVGTDSRSIKWLNQYKTKLQQIGAKGFLINVKSRQMYDAFVKSTGLHLAPINGDAIAKYFSISHYPVLITNNLIEQ